ncbi:NADH-dependent [FeFe] hydrogenase, group A6 [Thermosediminibacter oceani]|uniref:NAD(P)-dependent iron-only hydrogenase catalytic subunit n=1 Tax=Thermosediminibacter oceani (strain ATCC BAA-1034 / DSM 16646 / JW/IW-1228P) TaxID=555079 RepID=D9S1N4_THEOJ|nr:NADH-dependent [FeFe] hydrogenase, group A6 [Thermosediminibacter oceani]ADL07311.1 NAD(P)-dependent iron-only hydrogenase catalytic subunit [Thermosediminibacter oceani DSM 16646]
MKTLKINGREVAFSDEKNLLEVIRKAGIELPTFCYHSELSTYGACRMCLVEDKRGNLIAACSTPPREGMEIKTHTKRLLKQRRMTLELILAEHDRDCTTCGKNGDCKLRKLSHDLGVEEIRFGTKENYLPIDDSSEAIVRNPNKCILCGDCVRMCEEVQGIGVIGFAHRGAKAVVTPAFNKNLCEVECVDCGQCSAVCPTGAIVVKSHIDKVWDALNDDNKVVIAQIAPAVRVAFGEAFGLRPGESTEYLIVSALKAMGFDMVFDTCFAADLTVIEEGHEFLERLEKGENLPLFTSCCPAWVKFVEFNYPSFLNNLSSCRSPHQMFGSFTKNYYAKELGVSRENVYVVSIMPCTAKKAEAAREELGVDGNPDVDAVLTTRELIRMVREAGIVFKDLKEEPFDMPFGFSTGGGIIFGATGGVAEAVVRTLDGGHRRFEQVRGSEGLKEATIVKDGKEIRVAVVHGLKNARELLEKIKSGSVKYDMVEVMACPGGCVGGAGQPSPASTGVREERAKGLYNIDNRMQLARSDENPMIKMLYEKWLGSPGSEVAHKYLHTHYRPRRRTEV